MAKAAPVVKPAPKKAPAKKVPVQKTVAKKAAPKASKTLEKMAVARYQAPELTLMPKAEPLRPAGGWLRLLARLIDGMIMALVGLLFGLMMALLGMLVGAVDLSAAAGGVTSFDVLTWILGTILGLAYQGYFLSRHKATPGRMFLKLEVHHAQTGEALSFWRAVGRSVADWLNMLTLYLAYLIVFWRRDKRGIHDFIAKSCVVRRPEALPTWRLVMSIVLPVGWMVMVLLVAMVGFALLAATAVKEGIVAQPEATLPSIPLEAGPTE